MSQAEELLNGMSEEIPVHIHPVPDTDTYFVIDPITRQIENTNPKKNVIMQYDHNSERFTFELPRYIDGHDMLECTSVTVNVDNIEVVESEGDQVVEPRVNPDAPDMTDLRLHPNDPEKVICSWLISRNSTQLAGILSFHIEFKCVDSAGNVVYEWSTDQYDEITIKARKKNGEAAVAEHTDLLEQWRTKIFGAGDSVIANIETEGEAQVAAVKAESETQQEAVELKGAQTLDSIPEDYTEVDVMANEAVRSKGDAIVCETAGESIVLKDSSNDHIRGLKLFGKSKQATTTGAQLAYIPDIESYENNGIAWSSNGGIVTAKGNATIHSYTPSKIQADLKGLVGTFYLSGNGKYIKVAVQYTRDGVTNYINAPQEFTLDGTETRVELYCQITTYNTDVDDVAYPMVNVGNAALPWEYYTGGKPGPNPEYPQEIVNIENPTVSVCGKNLLIARTPNKSASGVTFTVNADNSVTIDGVSTSATFFNIDMESPITYQGVNLIASLGGGNNAVYMTIGYFDKDGGFVDTFVTVGNDEKEFVYPQEAVTSRVYIFINNATTFDNVTIYPMIRLASVDDKYEIGKESQSINIHRTLPGIPVTSGGNYTDSDGQQWICDELDLERGVYVQRVGIKDFDGSDDEDWGGVSEVTDTMRSWITVQGAYRPESDTANGIMCSQFNPQVSMNKGAFYQNRDRFFFGSGMTLNAWKTHLQSKPLQLVYILSTPIETPLTAEEIAAFKALRTNYPNTTILNDAGAWMSVKYNADTKSYVDNPKTLKLVDSSTGVVYELKVVDGALTVNPL